MGLRRLILLLVALWTTMSCNNEGKSPSVIAPPTPAVKIPASMPEFSADSAYAFIEKQVAFGPRVPNTAAHKACAAWLINKLQSYADEIKVQNGVVTAWNGDVLSIQNIIGRFNPEEKERILLFAHWDTRPFADQDPKNPKSPMDGASDGASGVGVLLEVARLLHQTPIPLGVDIIFFDAEDYGTSGRDNSFCLGSQFFASRVPVGNFKPRYGILLDMVGAAGATFLKERYSLVYAPDVVGKVWRMADALGFGSYFVEGNVGGIIDDHFYINTMLQIPSIDIIHYHPDNDKGFGDFWHTADDNMSIIDRNTLKAVGQTLMAVIHADSQQLFKNVTPKDSLNPQP